MEEGQRSQAEPQDRASAYLKCACHKKQNLQRKHSVSSTNTVNASIAQNNPSNNSIRLSARQERTPEARDEAR